ncbi:MAG TPA: selenium metabolism-associated LysR family transcriptional regulator [Spirochaetota bacterium]|nr:selenium metabolism-associated LysR family transcriptional regulator [Spirochaetota bacterium]HRZ28811.1 selenium metabolism-associated LysR family transcriptional regulator [Spirochaetota bacterium]HSA16155.1 selenium metabolism-associated LysR family transcriptional regulator [Spirochaetota bacterium]
MKNREINFDIKQLVSFLEVAREQNFTRASRNLSLGQATISHHIGQLEKMFGVTLMNRTSKDFSLTPEGEAFRDFCMKLFGDIDGLLRSFSEAASGGVAEIAASTIPSTYIIPAVIARLKEKNPQFFYRVSVSDSREVVELIKEGRAEIGVLGRLIKHPSLAYDRLMTDEIVLIGPNPGPDTVSAKEIPSLKMIMRESGSGTRNAVENSLSGMGIRLSDLNIVYECSTTEAVKEAVAAGIGCSFVSKLAIERELEQNTFRIIRTRGMTISRDFYVVYQKNRPRGRAAALFLDEIRRRV